MEETQGQNPADTQGNSSGTEVSAENTAESITSVMNDVSGGEPGAEPASGGDKDEGKSTAGHEPENPKWMAQLGKETLANADIVKQLGKFNSIDDLGRSYSELEKKLGSSVSIPGEDASEEDKAAFYRKLGRPDSADGYSIAGDDAKPFRDAAFRHNLTDSQAKGMYELLTSLGTDAIKANYESIQRMGLETDRKLREEWGTDYGRNLEYLKRGIAAHGGNTLGAKLKAAGLLYDIDVVRMLSSVGRMSSESEMATRGAGGKEDYVPTSEGGTFGYDMSFLEK